MHDFRTSRRDHAQAGCVVVSPCTTVTQSVQRKDSWSSSSSGKAVVVVTVVFVVMGIIMNEILTSIRDNWSSSGLTLFVMLTAGVYEIEWL
jgi:hypothetical protein